MTIQEADAKARAFWGATARLCNATPRPQRTVWFVTVGEDFHGMDADGRPTCHETCGQTSTRRAFLGRVGLILAGLLVPKVLTAATYPGFQFPPFEAPSVPSAAVREALVFPTDIFATLFDPASDIAAQYRRSFDLASKTDVSRFDIVLGFKAVRPELAIRIGKDGSVPLPPDLVPFRVIESWCEPAADQVKQQNDQVRRDLAEWCGTDLGKL